MTHPPEPLPEWARAHGTPVCRAALRAHTDDFRVDEELGFEAAGDGEHDFLHIEKVGANTAWVASRLARHAGIAVRDVGYCGLKDRDAVTTQYFTVRRPNRDGTDWAAFAADGVRVLAVARHDRKLRRGAHAANHFRIVARGTHLDERTETLEERWRAIVAFGVPNYFGEQRFGRDASNLALARDVLVQRRRVRREQRAIAISAARSLLFNRILNARVSSRDWDRLVAGDLANLAGSRSVFAVEAVTPELAGRCAAHDLHPAGTLWGRDAPLVAGSAGERELAAVSADADLAAALVNANVEAGHRPLRLCLDAARLTIDTATLVFEFRLPPGAFATAVLREILSPT